MNVVILAAGYATRLYPLTLTQPKPLLPVAGRPMIDYVVGGLAGVPDIHQVFIATNAKFAGQFEHWAGRSRGALGDATFVVVNDGSTDDSNKLGAIGDLRLVLNRYHLQDDLLVVAGDNLFSESLRAFGECCRARQAPVLGVYDVGSVEQAKKYGVVEVNAVGQIMKFEEKPPHPSSTLIGIALYYYPAAVVPLIDQYLAAGNNPDQPGRFVQWLYPRLPVFTWTVPGIWYDIGSKETLEEANRIFSRR